MGAVRFSDDQLLAAVVENPTIPAAAKAAGCSGSTIARRLKDAAFRQRLDDQRRKMLDASTDKLKQARQQAINLLIETMQNDYEETATRLRAASLILQYSKPTDGSGGR